MTPGWASAASILAQGGTAGPRELGEAWCLPVVCKGEMMGKSHGEDEQGSGVQAQEGLPR